MRGKQVNGGTWDQHPGGLVHCRYCLLCTLKHILNVSIDLQVNTDSLVYFSASASYRPPSAGGWKGLVGSVLVCVWLLTPDEGQKCPEVKR